MLQKNKLHAQVRTTCIRFYLIYKHFIYFISDGLGSLSIKYLQISKLLCNAILASTIPLFFLNIFTFKHNIPQYFYALTTTKTTKLEFQLSNTHNLTPTIYLATLTIHLKTIYVHIRDSLIISAIRIASTRTQLMEIVTTQPYSRSECMNSVGLP